MLGCSAPKSARPVPAEGLLQIEEGTALTGDVVSLSPPLALPPLTPLFSPRLNTYGLRSMPMMCAMPLLQPVHGVTASANGSQIEKIIGSQPRKLEYRESNKSRSSTFCVKRCATEKYGFPPRVYEPVSCARAVCIETPRDDLNNGFSRRKSGVFGLLYIWMRETRDDGVSHLHQARTSSKSLLLPGSIAICCVPGSRS